MRSVILHDPRSGAVLMLPCGHLVLVETPFGREPSEVEYLSPGEWVCSHGQRWMIVQGPLGRLAERAKLAIGKDLLTPIIDKETQNG